MTPFQSAIRWLGLHDPRERTADSYVEELNYQCRHLLYFVCLCSLIWLTYIPVDQKLHPDEGMIFYLRLGWIGASAFIAGISFLPVFAKRFQALLAVVALVLVVNAGLITALAGNDPTYFAGFLFVVCLVPIVPLQKRYTLGVVWGGAAAYLLANAWLGADLSTTRAQYSLNDLYSAVGVLSFLTFFLDRLRHSSWKNAHEVERRSTQKVEQAQAEVRAKSRFLATMSHEIRTPMNGVVGMAELLQVTSLSSQQRKYVDIITHSGKALLDIINDILDYSKIEAGKLNIEKIDFDLSLLCHEVASVFDVVAGKKQVHFVSYVETHTPEFVRGDPTRVRQILLNLLGNAFKFTSEGAVMMSAKIEKMGDGENFREFVRFWVRDSGIGMSEEQVAALFRPFTQADASTTRKYGGTGLGLSIARKLAELMGGAIGVESELGQGSSFFIDIPLELATPGFIAENRRDLRLLESRRVLVVEQHPEYARILRSQMQYWGMQVTTVSSYDEALLAIAAGSGLGPKGTSALFCVDANVVNEKQLMKLLSAASAEDIEVSVLYLLPSDMDIEIGEGFDPEIVHPMKSPTSIFALQQKLRQLYSNRYVSKAPTLSPVQVDLGEVHILVAEDNKINQVVVSNMLRKIGVSCEIVGDGLRALERYREFHDSIDLILMDCDMPEMDGLEATTQIREFEKAKKLAQVPIVALTAHVLAGHQERCLTVGMSDCVTKPVEMEVLARALQQQLRTRSEIPSDNLSLAV